MIVANPWLPYGACARVFFLASLPFLPVLLIGFTRGTTLGTVVGAIGTMLFLTLVLVGVIFLYVKRMHTDRLVRLNAKSGLAHWTCDSGAWERFLARREIRSNRVPLYTTGVFGAVGLVIGFYLLEQKQPILNSTFATLLIPTLLGAVPGLYFGMLIWYLDHLALAEMARRIGEVWIGREAVYLTGQLTPLNSLNMSLEKVELRQAGRDLCLAFHSRNAAGRYAAWQETEVPVPPEEEETARKVLAAFEPDGA